MIAQADLSDDGNDALRRIVDILGDDDFNDDGLELLQSHATMSTRKVRDELRSSDEELINSASQNDLTLTRATPARRKATSRNNNLQATKSHSSMINAGSDQQEDQVTLADDDREDRVLRERVRLQRIRP